MAARSATPPPLLYRYRDSARRLSPAVHLIYSGLLPSPLFPRGCIIIQVAPLLLIGIPEIHIRKTLCKRLFLSLALIFAIIIFLFNGLPKLFNASMLDRVRTDGMLIVLTRNSPTTYYEGPDGPAGLEYDLVKMFADELGVELTMIVPDSFTDVLKGITHGNAHFAAAGLTVTEKRKQLYRFTPGYQQITEQLVYNVDHKKPKDLSSLGDGLLEVVAGSSHEERLEHLQQVIKGLSWKSNNELESEELLQLVADDVIDYTIADSNEVALNQRFMLKLRVAFDISEPQDLAWAFPKDDDNSLYLEAVRFFEKIRENGELTRLIERAYGHVGDFDYVGTIIFRRHIAQRLPRYRQMFEDAGAITGIDWRLLAAMSYQESHWDPKAVSPTGVRGIMMLTQKTAASLGVKNRLDPQSSIDGGARYFASTLERIPDDIVEPDRTWMALAAYNVGTSHLVDARIITEQRGLDPHKWIDVKTSLPLLAKHKWYKDTRAGYARGWEPVQYVENTRSYYDMLHHLDAVNEPREPEPEVFSILPQVP